MDTDETRILASEGTEPNGLSGDWGCDFIAAFGELDLQVRMSGQGPKSDDCAYESPRWDTTDEEHRMFVNDGSVSLEE